MGGCRHSDRRRRRGLRALAGEPELGKAAFQTAINAGFKELTDQLQEERDFFRRQLAEERIAWSAERSDFTGQIRDLRQSIESLKALLRRNGVEVPEHHAAVADFTVLPGKDEE